MEMCYNGALVMPSNYVVMDEEEMTYVNAGDAKNFKNNLVGLWNKSKDFRYALGQSGITYGMITAVASYSYTMAVTTFGIPVSLAASAAGPIAAGAAALGAVGIITYLWNKRVFY